VKKVTGGGADQPVQGTRYSCYGCFLPDLTGFTTSRHLGSRPLPPLINVKNPTNLPGSNIVPLSEQDH